jgi:hypothetical protein
MTDTSALPRGLPTWGGSAALVTVGVFWAALLLARPLAATKAGELIASILWFPYVVGVPLIGFATLFIASRRAKHFEKPPQRLLVQALLAFLSVAIWFTSLATRLIELP